MPRALKRTDGTAFKLTPDQGERFCVEYLKDFDAGAAFARAFPESKNAAAFYGPRIISRNPWLAEKIRRRSEGRITLADITPARITLELAKVALADLRKTVNTRVDAEAGELKEHPIPLAMIDDDTASAIREVTYDRDGNRIVKTYDKVAALNVLAKISGVIAPQDDPASRNRQPLGHDSVGDDEIAHMLADWENDPDLDEGDEGDETIDVNGEGDPMLGDLDEGADA